MRRRESEELLPCTWVRGDVTRSVGDERLSCCGVHWLPDELARGRGVGDVDPRRVVGVVDVDVTDARCSSRRVRYGVVTCDLGDSDSHRRGLGACPDRGSWVRRVVDCDPHVRVSGVDEDVTRNRAQRRNVVLRLHARSGAGGDAATGLLPLDTRTGSVRDRDPREPVSVVDEDVARVRLRRHRGRAGSSRGLSRRLADGELRPRNRCALPDHGARVRGVVDSDPYPVVSAVGEDVTRVRGMAGGPGVRPRVIASGRRGRDGLADHEMPDRGASVRGVVDRQPREPVGSVDEQVTDAWGQCRSVRSRSLAHDVG